LYSAVSADWPREVAAAIVVALSTRKSGDAAVEQPVLLQQLRPTIYFKRAGAARQFG